MRVFVTGATGFVGSAVVRELLGAGHQVLGLARSEAGAKSIVAAGAEAHRGDIEDLDSLRSGAAQRTASSIPAFNHDFSKFAASCADGPARHRNARRGAGRFRAAAACHLRDSRGFAQGRPATEDDKPAPPSAAMPRASEAAAMALAARGVRASTVRLAPTVHGDGDHGFVPMLIAIAREKGVSAYVGDGHESLGCGAPVSTPPRCTGWRWRKGTGGVSYHAVGEQGVATREIAEIIGRRLNLPVVSKSPEEAAGHFGFLGHFIGRDLSASSEQTRNSTGMVADRAGAHRRSRPCQLFRELKEVRASCVAWH